MSLHVRAVSVLSAALLALTGGVLSTDAAFAAPSSAPAAETRTAEELHTDVEQSSEPAAAHSQVDPTETPEPEPSASPTPMPLVPGAVTITGTAQVGVKLTAKHGTWKPTPDRFTYQWHRGSAAIAGATTSTYTPAAADRGKKLAVTVTGTRAGYEPASTKSAATSAVKAGTPTKAPTPTVSGTTTVGSTLTAKAGTWAPGTFTLSYQWYRSGTAIKGATGAKYKLQSADAGKTLKVKVTGKRSGYSTTSRTSAATSKVGKKLTATPTPTISGTAKVGSVLTAKPGTWKPGKVTLRYQWQRGGTAIKGATKSTYKLVKADAGTKVTVRVTGSRSGYSSVAKTSAAKSVQKVLSSTPTPTISGSTKVGSTLTAKAGSWKPAPVTLSYQWYRSGTAIKGATSAKYKLKSADAGKTLRVKVTGKKSGFTTVSKTSAATSKVTYPSSVDPGTSWDCPAWAPIKGNESSMIYHMPHGAYYDRTNPEECFSTEAAARKAGYRKSKL